MKFSISYGSVNTPYVAVIPANLIIYLRYTVLYCMLIFLIEFPPGDRILILIGNRSGHGR